MMDERDIRYPIGPAFEPPAEITEEDRQRWLQELTSAPTRLREVTVGLSSEQIDTPYRTNGWTVRQIIHHLAENDLVAYTRFKFALTEDNPVIQPMAEDLWANLPDSAVSMKSSLVLFELIHERWVALISGLRPDELQRTYVHSVTGPMELQKAMGLYAWHAKHHTAQITTLRERMGW
jgi:uncharacterized damage-inducible protein DinB